MTNEELIKIAKKIQKNAFAKISNYGVGAALLAKSGVVYVGANIEDKIIPSLSNCAERVAIQNALSMGEREFDSIAIVGGYLNSEELDEIVPCGVCLQYMLNICKNINIVTVIDDKIISKKIEEYLKSPYEMK